jgi:hypothetical protein
MNTRILTRTLLAAAVAATFASPAAAESPFALELEVGPVWQSSNDVQIPNDDTGTRFSLKDAVGQGPWFTGRLSLTWNMNEKHSFRGVIAPLSYTETGRIDEDVFFVDQQFTAGDPVEASYRFNSYRLTYRYRFHDSDEWTWWVGGTAFIRDAEIKLRQGDVEAADDNIGFVPLLHLGANWRLSDQWRAILELDALAGGPGRAIDLGLKLGYDVSDDWSVTAGYRTVEGGADTDDVYNFAWFHSAVVSGIYRF